MEDFAINTQKILVAVCGGIAAYKSAELVRLLRKENWQVQVLMTDAAREFISPLTFQALSGHAVHTQLLDAQQENAMGHIKLARWADAIVIAPATANCIAKLRYGLADDLLSTLYLAASCPIYIAPAMNSVMWQKPITQENLTHLQEQGVKVIPPTHGELVCGEQGIGRMAEPMDILNVISAHHAVLGHDSECPQLLKGVKILISAGPTREPLDPVRYITNRSSGKMGYALAEAAVKMGASVTLVSGPVNLSPPIQANVLRVETAEQMYQAVMQVVQEHEVYIGAAAVADYTFVQVNTEKIKTGAEEKTLVLQKTKDILAAVGLLDKRPFIVGFAAETDALEMYAKAKLERKKADMIAANWVGKQDGGFEKNENALHVFWYNGDKKLVMMDKKQLAYQLLELMTERMREKNTA